MDLQGGLKGKEPSEESLGPLKLLCRMVSCRGACGSSNTRGQYRLLPFLKTRLLLEQLSSCLEVRELPVQRQTESSFLS